MLPGAKPVSLMSRDQRSGAREGQALWQPAECTPTANRISGFRACMWAQGGQSSQCIQEKLKSYICLMKSPSSYVSATDSIF